MNAGHDLIVEADGGSRGNPGVAGYGALVRDRQSGDLLWEGAAPLGTASNNVAEYRGLIAGLRAAAETVRGPRVLVRMDSKLVVEQMSGRWKIKHEDMRRLAMEAREVVRDIEAEGGSVEFEWIPRAANTAADALSNTGMDGEAVDRRWSPSGEVEETEAIEEVIDPTAPEEQPDIPGPDLGAPTRVLLVRHGVTRFTVEARLDGRGGVDPSLTERGVQQAAAAGRAAARLIGDAKARLVTSSLTRAIETAAEVGAALRLTAEVDPDWDEQNFGDWDGQSMHDLVRDHPEDVMSLRRDPMYARPGGESHEELVSRVLAAFDRAVTAGGTTVVVCHRKPIMVVLAHLLEMPHEAAWRIAAAPGSLTAVEVWSDGTASVSFTNRT